MKKLMYLLAFLITFGVFGQTINHRHKVKLTEAGALELTVPDSLLSFASDNQIRWTKLTDVATKLNPLLSISASNVSIATGVGTPTIDQVQEYIDNIGSSGFFLGGVISDGGAGTVDVAAGSGFIRTTNDDNAELQSFKWSASSGIAVTDNTTQYIYVDDVGTISLSTDEFLETPDKIQIGVVTDESGVIVSFFSLGVRLEESIGQAGRFIRRVHGITRDKRKGGLIFGQSGDANRDVSITVGSLLWGRTEYPFPAFNTSGADTFQTYSAGGQEDAGASQWNNTLYDNVGTLTTLDNNKWANLFFFIIPNNGVIMVYGRSQFTSQALAETEGVPSTSLPTKISETSILAARFIFQKSSNTAVISSAFDTLFANAGVTDHGNLAGLSDDDHTQYLLYVDATLQNAYENSIVPNILTNVTLNAFTIQRGTASDSDNVFEVRNGAGDSSFSVDGNGNIILSGLVDAVDIAAEETRLANTSGSNTGDQNLQEVTDLGATTTNFITIDNGTAGNLNLGTSVTLSGNSAANALIINVGSNYQMIMDNEDGLSINTETQSSSPNRVTLTTDLLTSSRALKFPDASGTIVIRTGTPANQQVTFWSGSNTIEGSQGWTFTEGNATNPHQIFLGNFDNNSGIGEYGIIWLEGAGTGGTFGGRLHFATAADFDATITSYKIEANEDDFVFAASTGTLMSYDGGTSRWRFNTYGTGTITGAATFTLAVDTNGNIIEEPLPNVTAQTGTVLDLGFNRLTPFNIASASNATTYTTTNIVIGGAVKCLINAATEPVVTGATKISSPTFQANTDMFMVVYTDDGTNVEFYFLLK